MADVKWIKIVTDIFDDEKILLIESLPSADSIIVIWFKLLCLAGKNNNSGVFIMNDKIPYTDEMLATIFRRDINTVRLALKTFENYGMIEIVDGVYSIPNWGKHQTLDKVEQKNEYMRKYMQEYREKQRRKIECKSNGKSNSNSNSKANVSEADKEIDNKELDTEDKKELEKEKELDNTPPLSPSQGDAPNESKRKGKRNQNEEKHHFGEYQHVMLTDEQLNKLFNDYGELETHEAIKFLDEYIEMKGYKAKNHNLALRKWVFRAVDEEKAKQRGRVGNYQNRDINASRQSQLDYLLNSIREDEENEQNGG